MKRFQPNQPALWRKQEGRVARLGSNNRPVKDEIIDIEPIYDEAPPAASGKEEDSGHVRIIDPNVVNEVRREAAERPVPPTTPPPPASEPVPTTSAAREKTPPAPWWYANAPQIVKFGVLGFGLALFLSLFGGRETSEEKAAVKPTETATTPATTGVRRMDTPVNNRILPAGIYLILAEEGWSEPVSVPLGGDLRWSSMRNGVKFQVQTAGGEVFDYPRPENSHLRLPNSGFVRFRSAEEVPVEIRVTVLHR